VVDVLSADAVKIRPGAQLWVEDWGGDAPATFVVEGGRARLRDVGVGARGPFEAR
jgi:hypothetical protein